MAEFYIGEVTTTMTPAKKMCLYVMFAWIARDCQVTIAETDSDAITVSGVGATFPVEVYNQWGTAFMFERSDYESVDYIYQTSNSRHGKLEMRKNTPSYAFGASEIDLTPAEEVLDPQLRVIPVIAGGVVLAYHLPWPMPTPLVLARETVVGIYNGSVNRWDDPEILRHNPNLWFPPEIILPIARADDSGTTEIFTRALSAISPEWNKTYGTFYEGLNDFFGPERPVHWNSSVVRYYGRTNRGMTGLVFSYRYSVGYMSAGEALAVNQTYALIINQANNTVDINTTATAEVMHDVFFSVSPSTTAFAPSLVDSSRPYAYPFLGISYFIINVQDMPDCLKARELYFYIEWVLTNDLASEIASDFAYNTMLPVVSRQVIDNVLVGMTCGDGKNVAALVKEQKEHEQWMRRKPMRIGVSIGLSLGFLLILGFIIFIVLQRLRVRRALRAGEWNIHESDVDIKWDRNKGWMYTPSSKFSDFGSTITGLKSVVSDGVISQHWSMFISKYGKWNNKIVCLRKFPQSGFKITTDTAKMSVMNMTSKMIHNNVLRFCGITEIDSELYLVSEHAEKGCLTDVLQNARYKLDDNFKYALALDIAHGMDFLHTNHITHGNLNSDCCLLDARWNIKITQWEILRMYAEERERKLSRIHPVYEDEMKDQNVEARAQMWEAPEILQSLVRTPTKKSDVYSFAILTVEIFSREDPYTELADAMEPTDIIKAITKDGLRPDLSMVENKKIKPIIMSAWQEDPHKRPTFGNLIRELRRRKSSKKSVIESMMDTLEEYVINLEEKVQERTAELADVNKSLENLLHQILPATVARSLSKGETVKPEQFDCSTIFFSDIVGFTTLCAQSGPMDVVNLLNDLYTTFDSIIDKLDVYKVETIGDAYMCISGVPIRNGIRHADNIATMALQLVEEVKTFKIRHRPPSERLQLRAGIHSGPVVAGVVGVKMPRYCLFGDTVNTASRMESTSVAMKIQISPTTHALLVQLGGYEFESRGGIEVKGKGIMTTYFILGKTVPGCKS